MGKDNRNVKIIAIAALLVAVIGVSIGFAAFTRTLTIEAGANVTPTDDFNVVFSKSNSSVTTEGGVDASSKTPSNLTTSTAVIANDATGGPKISNLHATFTQPGQSATYTFYAYNDSSYGAYLTNIIFTPAATKCTASTGSTVTSALMTSACSDISIKVSVGTDTNTANVSASKSVSGHALAAGAAELVTVVISYDQVSGQTLADGAFDVDFGTIQLKYKTVDTAD